MLRVVYDASVEVRSSVVYGTAIVVLVFIPLFALEGMEGKLFVPLAMGYVVSLIASLGVSLTVTPVLASLLMVGKRNWQMVVPVLAFGIAGLTVTGSFLGVTLVHRRLAATRQAARVDAVVDARGLGSDSSTRNGCSVVKTPKKVDCSRD